MTDIDTALSFIYKDGKIMASEAAMELQEQDCYVALTHDHLNAQNVIDRVRSPKAGAIVLFAGL